mgnify:CR=1 FL=1
MLCKSTSEIMKILAREDITLTDVIDAVITANGIIGVGLISLSDDIQNYIIHWEKERSK